jgi:hypothetical protein
MSFHTDVSLEVERARWLREQATSEIARFRRNRELIKELRAKYPARK